MFHTALTLLVRNGSCFTSCQLGGGGMGLVCITSHCCVLPGEKAFHCSGMLQRDVVCMPHRMVMFVCNLVFR